MGLGRVESSTIGERCGFLDDSSGTALAGAIEANQVAQLSLLARTDNGKLESHEKLMWFVSGIPSGGLNGVGRAQLSALDIGVAIKDILHTFKLHHVPMTWWVGPSASPSDLEQHLLANGLIHAGHLRGMALDLRQPLGELRRRRDLTIEPATDAATLETFMNVFAAGFGLKQHGICEALLDLWRVIASSRYPCIRHYIASLKQEPVAIFSLLFAEGVAGIYHVTTIPRARRQGIGTALVSKAIEEARRAGLRFATLVAAQSAVGLYRRIGFEEYCTFRLYGWAPVSRGAFLTSMIRAKHFLKRFVTI